jgi:dipeptidyl aminopeptidase/acylaminoacyl peptidase
LSRVRVVAVDSRRLLWRSGQLEDVRALAWSPAGRRLLVVTGRRLILFDGTGRRLLSRAIPAGFTVTAAAWSPRGREIALVRRGANGSLLMLADAARGLSERTLFSGPGRFGTPAWSPDAARLLLPWPDADQWLFLRPHGGPRVTAVGHIAAQFGPGRLRPAFPRGVQWCC